MDKGIEKIAKRFVKKCPKCGTEFYPWKTLMVTLPQNGMKPYVYCPQCKFYADLEVFKKD